MAIERIEVVQLPTANVARARQFYEHLLDRGPTLEGVGDADGGFVQFDPATGASLALQEPPSAHDAPRGPVIAFQVAAGTDVEGLLKNIEADGGTITSREVRTPDWLVVAFTDPDGNCLELLVRH